MAVTTGSNGPDLGAGRRTRRRHHKRRRGGVEPAGPTGATAPSRPTTPVADLEAGPVAVAKRPGEKNFYPTAGTRRRRHRRGGMWPFDGLFEKKETPMSPLTPSDLTSSPAPPATTAFGQPTGVQGGRTRRHRKHRRSRR